MNHPVYYVKCIDPDSKQIYYFNKTTHETLRSCPSGINDRLDDNLMQYGDETYRNYVQMEY